MNDANGSGASARLAEIPEPQDNTKSEPPFPVVGIGASLGGLTAFTRLLAKLPPATGMAFVLIQHLDPTHDSELARLLAKDSPLPVCDAGDGMLVEANHVYVTPPNVLLELERGRLRLKPCNGVSGRQLTIDHFFRSLAETCAGRAVGVLLSGTGTDGTLGLAEIKEAGGITFAEDPKSAAQAEMPRNAIAYGCVDFVLTDQEIAHEMGVISAHPYLTQAATANELEPFNNEADAYEKVLALLMTAGGVNFTHYRSTAIKRRILRRMALRQSTMLVDYLAYLTNNIGEIDLLLKDVLINVTCFFRDEEVFAAIRASVFPELVKGHTADVAIRIWVVGCSTGQEPYSLAIELTEYLDTMPLRPLIQIFATDISESSLAVARAGIYPDNIQNEVSAERLRRHFTKVTEGYRVNKSLRDICVFAKHDVTADTPFSKIDLLTCRNMLIYLSPALQTRMIPIFHYALSTRGFMVLGSSETTGRSSDLFTVVDLKQRIYLKHHNGGRSHPLVFSRTPPLETNPTEKPVVGLSNSLADYQRAADRFVLSRYAPAGVLIDGDLNIIQFRGDIGEFLDHSRGEASLNLLKLVPYDLGQVLKEAVDEVRQRNVGVERLGIHFRNRAEAKVLNLRINPIRPHGVQDGCMLVLFEKLQEKDQTTAGSPTLPSSEPLDEAKNNPQLRLEIAGLRQELSAANDYLKALAEENNAVADELKFANDEAHSSNEELRCTNEELQTAKEEVLSANEELVTLNEELRARNLDLTVLSNDLTNLLASIDLPVIMLGEDLRMRRMTPAAERNLRLAITDLGRPIDAVNLELDGVDLAQLARDVIQSKRSLEIEIKDRQGLWFTLRINPYRTESNRVMGAVVVLIDIDTVKRAQDHLRKTADFSQAIFETVRDPLVVLNHELRVDTANRAFCRLFGLTNEAVVGKLIYELNQGQWDIQELRRLLDDISKNHSVFDNFEVTRNFPGLGERSVLLNARCLEERGDQPSHMIVLAITDVTEQKRITDNLKATSSDLLRSNAELDQFASIASHDLLEPMRMIRSYGALLKKKLGDGLDDQSQEYLGSVLGAAKRMQDLIKAILEYSRAGHQDLKYAEVDLGETVRGVMMNLDRAIVRASATIDCCVLPTIHGDDILLTQLFQNLLGNALKFRSVDRPCVVTVRAQQSDEDWTFSIADNGIGIRPEDFERIFNIFQRLHAPADYPGTGIGLATCKKIVDRHHGRIWIESTLTVGTTFHFSLPKTVPNPAPPAETAKQ